MHMAYCDFCECSDCKNGAKWLTHAKTLDGKWICDICWRYDVCVTEKRKSGLYEGPCEDLNRKPIVNCSHRPKLSTKFF
jgi:hypothetical protein